MIFFAHRIGRVMLMQFRAVRSCNNVWKKDMLYFVWPLYTVLIATNTGKKGGGWDRHLLNGKESSLL